LANSTSILTQGVIDLGLAHEKAILETLSQNYEVHEALSVKHTMELMEQGVTVYRPLYSMEMVVNLRSATNRIRSSTGSLPKCVN